MICSSMLQVWTIQPLFRVMSKGNWECCKYQFCVKRRSEFSDSLGARRQLWNAKRAWRKSRENAKWLEDSLSCLKIVHDDEGYEYQVGDAGNIILGIVEEEPAR